MLETLDPQFGTAGLPDPFRTEREADGVAARCFHGERMVMLLRWQDVRAAARDPARFDSGQSGRIPTPPETDIRDFRQIPIETNPPDHGLWRDLLQPYFRRPTQPGPRAEIEAILHDGVTAAMAGRVEVVTEFALPVQSAALAVLLDADRGLAGEWIAWGLHAFGTGGKTDPVKAARFLEFIDRMLDRGAVSPDQGLFSYLHRARFKDRPLSRDQMRGICHLALAGGRDTVINAVTGVIAYLAQNPGELDRLRADPGLIITASEEFFRVLSPLPMIGRVCPEGLDTAAGGVAPGARAGLCWAAANRDAQVFEAANEIRLDRKPNPHVAFGAGAHTCLGAPMARLILRSLLSQLASRVARVDLLDAEPRETEFGTPFLFNRLSARLIPRVDHSGDTP